MGELSQLVNIGKTLEEQLNAIGIQTVSQLRETGSREAWRRIKSADPSACYNRLCALEGALQGIRWHDLPDGVKEDLKIFYQSQK